MKDNALDVLVYLFKNYIDGELEYVPDRESLQTELLEAGFLDGEIVSAFNWLDELANGDSESPQQLKQSESIRLFTEQEMQVLGPDCRGFLLFLEQVNVITPDLREVIIDRAMALEETDLPVERLKWVVVMVLFNQPEQSAHYDWIESVIFDGAVHYLH
jgi:Smg protein